MNLELTSHELNALFEPKSIAIIGASTDPAKLGGRPIRYMKEGGFQGLIYPVNPKNDQVQGLKAYQSIADIPDQIDLALILLPAYLCVNAVKECISKGVRIILLFSSGFAEEGAHGKKLQDEIETLTRIHNVRILGPNCLGVVSVANRFFGTFSTALEALEPSPGTISIATQSGAFGSCAYSMAIQRGIGLSKIVSTGNEVNIDVASCIEYFAEDPSTKVICAAIEGCRDGEALRSALLKAADNKKPVVFMKVGTSELGVVAAATHTGSLAGDDAIFDAVLEECGAWRAQSIEEMLDIAYFCSIMPEPISRSASIVTVSGGIGILMADDCEKNLLELPPLPENIIGSIKKLLPFAPIANPLDTTAQVSAVKNGVALVLEQIVSQTDWPIFMVYMAQSAAAPLKFEPLKQALIKLRKNYPERCFVLIGPSDANVVKDLEANGFVVLADPTRAVKAMGAYRQIVERRETLRKSTALVSSSDPICLPDVSNESSAKKFLHLHGLPIVTEELCNDSEEAVKAALSLGFPVALKIVSEQIIHKTEIGGVELNLQTESEVRNAFKNIEARAKEKRPDAVIDGILVSPMIHGGVETILGISHDPVFGPMVMFGLGGISVELFKDVAFASAPLTKTEALKLIDKVRGSALLKGWRGQPALDVAALADALVSLSIIAKNYANDINSIDINPFLVRSHGGVCLDAVIIKHDH